MKSTSKQTPMAILGAVRTPFCKAGTSLAEQSAVQLGVAAVRECIARLALPPAEIEEVILGNVSSPADAANIARVVALQAGIPHDRIAHTVNRNCASGMESLIQAWQVLREGRAGCIVAGGTESMSAIPLLVRRDTAALLQQLSRSRSIIQRLKVLSQFRPRHLRPIPAVLLGLTDPTCGLNMGETAERLAVEFQITREAQDQFALESHRRACAAQASCFLSSEILSCNGRDGEINRDNGPRPEQSMQQLARLKPVFAEDGTVTAGNSCPLTDGAAAMVVTLPDHPLAQEREPLGYITGYAVAGCDPRRMGLGPVFSTARLLQQTGMAMSDFDLVELNEAFAAQVLACQAAFDSKRFASEELGRSTAIGTLDPARLNLHGGAIALGHPVGTTGTRIVMTLLRSLRKQGLNRGLATLCIGGGQGMALMVEVHRPE